MAYTCQWGMGPYCVCSMYLRGLFQDLLRVIGEQTLYSVKENTPSVDPHPRVQGRPGATEQGDEISTRIWINLPFPSCLSQTHILPSPTSSPETSLPASMPSPALPTMEPEGSSSHVLYSENFYGSPFSLEPIQAHLGSLTSSLA